MDKLFTVIAYDGNDYVVERVTATSPDKAISTALDQHNTNLEDKGTVQLSDFDVIAIFEGHHKPLKTSGAIL